MARGKPVVLESITFANQGLAAQFFKAMLNRYIPGETVSEADAVHLGELFKRHPDYISKVATGVDHFEVMSADYASQCFCAVQKNGDKEGFSYPKCITQGD